MIYRHQFDISRIANNELLLNYKNRIQNSFQRLRDGKKVAFQYLKNDPLEIAKTNIINESNHDIYNFLELYLQIGIGNFDRYFTTEDSTEVLINGETFKCEKIDDSGGIDYFNWLNLFSIALILRSQKYLQKIVSLQSKIDDPFKFWKFGSEFLVSVFNQNEKNAPSFLNNIKEIAKQGTSVEFTPSGQNQIQSDDVSEILTILWLPIFELYDFAFQSDHQGFNSKMEEYLLQRKKYIVDKKLIDDGRYWIDFPFLGCCSYAHDAGIKIDIQTEYAPKKIYENMTKDSSI